MVRGAKRKLWIERTDFTRGWRGSGWEGQVGWDRKKTLRGS